jgi:hypothetical protein
MRGCYLSDCPRHPVSGVWLWQLDLRISTYGAHDDMVPTERLHQLSRGPVSDRQIDRCIAGLQQSKSGQRLTSADGLLGRRCWHHFQKRAAAWLGGGGAVLPKTHA